MDRKTTRLESDLCKAVKDGEPRSVQQLLVRGACPDLVSRKGVAAIHLAVGKESEKNTRCLRMLLQHGADPNVRSSEGLTPLHIAALWGCYQNLKLLLMNGGNPNSKDNDGNTPGQLAEQQENRKCAQLLQGYRCSPVDAEEDDLPQFQYSVYSDQTDTSGYPESDGSFTSPSSLISDFGDAPLSSTRHSALFFNMSNVDGRPSCRAAPHNGLSDVDGKRAYWDNSTSRWASEGPSMLSSTRMSALGPAVKMQTLKEDDLCTYDVFTAKANDDCGTTDGRISASRRDALSAFPPRRSVSFMDVDEYFPVFTPESPKGGPAVEGSAPASHLPFDPSAYSDFLDSERVAAVLHKQGIDVTSPDHVYVFCRESSGSAAELDKTVVARCALEDSGDEQGDELATEARVDAAERTASACASSSGSGTGTSNYSSCESDHYTSALEASVHSGHLLRPAEEVIPVQTSSGSGSIQTENHVDSGPDTGERLPATLDKDAPCEVKHPKDDEREAPTGPSVEGGADPPANGVAEALKDSFHIPFPPSPYVTGRTPSRLSRCSMRTSRTPESFFFTSSLFEETLPTPVRAPRHAPRSPSSADLYGSPRVPSCYRPSRSGSGTGRDHSPAGGHDTQSSTVGADSSVSNSQADTLILSRTATESVVESQTLSSTAVLERSQEAYERNLAEIIRAIRGHDLADGGDFMTDDRTSTDEAATKRTPNAAAAVTEVDSLKTDDVWVTEDCYSSSQLDSVSSSSSAGSSSPRRSRVDSDHPSTPATGCTPRYSMSRLSGRRRAQRLASLSYTPGGRPHIRDLDEPVEYLYTDVEQGHKLIETHVPPTANASLSASSSSSGGSSEETVLYDWRSMQTAVARSGGKENQKSSSMEGSGERSSPEMNGLTDKELRRRLVELGESPGPVCSRTRPAYMKRLCRLLKESNSQSPRSRKQLDHQPQTDFGYSPELCRTLQTFTLPDCQADEQALCQQFDQPDQNRKWREGIIKSSFNYLLLDPRVTNNLPFRSHTMSPQECFQTFLHAIFYVGKGKRSRPYSHLYEALEYYTGDKFSKKLCPKVQHILQVWGAGHGVVSLHCFQSVIPVEAYTREACMVEAIGLKMLTNQKRGDFYGVVSNWHLKRRRELGVHLLYRAMQIFLAEGERQLRPADIRQQ